MMFSPSVSWYPNLTRQTLRLAVCIAVVINFSATSEAAAQIDPWMLPFVGFRDGSEGMGPTSVNSGGIGIQRIKVPHGRGDIQTLVLTDCAKYQDWQTIVAAFAWRESGQPGNVTRVVNCSPTQTKSYSKVMMEVMPTFWARQYSYNADINDAYAPYNKPGAVVDFLAKAPANERHVIVLDSDMLLHKPFLPEEFNLTRGWAVGAAGYTYLKGVANDLAMRHVSDIPPRNDTLSGPSGRRGDQVGGPYFMLMDDLRRVAPLWLSATKEMRQDLSAWKDSGDTAPPGKPVWISEMYGYSFGAARAGVWHRSAADFMFYPSYTPAEIPHVIHYGLQFQLQGWEFDKHYYIGFDPLKCPPWPDWQGYDAPRLHGLIGDALAAARAGAPPKPAVSHPQHGIFPPPPHPAGVNGTTGSPYLARYRDLLSIFTVAQINAALCEFHSATCPWSAQLEAICADAWELYLDVRDAVDEIEFTWGCADHDLRCAGWAKSGDCERRAAYMAEHCARSCVTCVPPQSGNFVARERPSLRFSARLPSDEQVHKVGARKIGMNSKEAASHLTIVAASPTQKHEEYAPSSTVLANLSESSAPEIISLVRRCALAFDPPLQDVDLGLCVRAATRGLAYMRSQRTTTDMNANESFGSNRTSAGMIASWLMLGITTGSAMLAIICIGLHPLPRRRRGLFRGILRADAQQRNAKVSYIRNLSCIDNC